MEIDRPPDVHAGGDTGNHRGTKGILNEWQKGEGFQLTGRLRVRPWQMPKLRTR